MVFYILQLAHNFINIIIRCSGSTFTPEKGLIGNLFFWARYKCILHELFFKGFCLQTFYYILSLSFWHEFIHRFPWSRLHSWSCVHRILNRVLEFIFSPISCTLRKFINFIQLLSIRVHIGLIAIISPLKLRRFIIELLCRASLELF